MSGPAFATLVRKIAESLAQQIFIEVARAHDIKARRPQGLGNQSRIVYRRRQSFSLVGGISDDERQTLFRRRGACRRQGHNGEEGQKSE